MTYITLFVIANFVNYVKKVQEIPIIHSRVKAIVYLCVLNEFFSFKY